MNKLPSYSPFVVPVIDDGRVAVTVPPLSPQSGPSPPNRKNGSYSLCHLDVHATPPSAEWRSRQSVMRTEACEKYLSGVEKKKKRRKEKKKQGSLVLAASTIGSHVDKVRKKKGKRLRQFTRNFRRTTTLQKKTRYRGYQGLRYKVTDMGGTERTHLSSPALVLRRHISTVSVHPYLKPDKGLPIQNVPRSRGDRGDRRTRLTRDLSLAGDR